MTVRVVLVVSILTHYRVRFHELVRDRLAAAGIRYELVIGTPSRDEAAKADTVVLPWATLIRNRPFAGLLWQPALRSLRGAQLVIATQENRLLLNYLLQVRRWLPGRRPRFAFFGHGRNFQARARNGAAERWKRWWATRADWWFGYTDETGRHVEGLGFPADRITIFDNAVDTADVRALAAAVSPETLARRRAELGIAGVPVAIFVGGLYPDKRIAFLIAAAEHVRACCPGFVLLVVGGGVDLPLLRTLAADRPWIRVLGPRFGADKVELMRLADLFLMPGLLGLAVLDAAAAGLPVVTTRYPWHSPEIAYLRDGVTGVIVPDWQDPAAYGDAVVGLLADRPRLDAMVQAAHALAGRYTIEAMAERFAGGVIAALATPAR